MNLQDVTIDTVRFLRGPNLYAYLPVVQVILDIGPYEQRPSTSFPGFVDRLLTWLPGLQTHECSLNRPGGFVERLRQGTYLAHIFEHVTLELQNLMGFQVHFGRARSWKQTGVYNVVIEYQEEEPVRAALDTALRLILAAMHDQPFDWQAETDRLLEVADEYRLGPSTAAIVAAAQARDIPVLRITPKNSLVQLGYGVYQKRIWASETSNTSAIAEEICQEKLLTNHMLRTVGVPVPDGRIVDSAEDAWQAAREIGRPVVVKPVDGNQGKGASVNLTTEADIRQAYAVAEAFGGQVLVEQYIEGADYRLLVVNGQMVAAARRDPAQVVGNGESTIQQLVQALNRDPRRRPGHSGTLTQISLDEAVDLVLRQQGLTPESVPMPGQVVLLRTNANLSTGGTATDVTDQVCPSNARLAELAAQILSLDVAGIDIVCRDSQRPLREQRGAIIEVNAAPGLRMHLHPTHGQPRPVGKSIVEMLYPQGASSRIPVIAITGTNGKTTVTRLVAHMYETARWVVGMTSTEGTYIDREQILQGDCSGPQSAQAVLLHPRVEVAVLETARGGILREGLAFDSCLVGVVTNVSGDHLGLKGVNTVEELARVKQVVIEAVDERGTAVLNAEDPLVAEMAAATDAQVIYFSLNPEHHVIKAHLAEGGRCVFMDHGTLVLASDGNQIELVELERLAFTAGGKIRFQVQNALAATAAAWAAGLNPALIARALSTFKTDSATVPGRFNISDINGVQVIVDYAHNLEAMKALSQAVESLGKRRTVMMMTLPGDRRDQDLFATLDATRPFADEYVLYETVDRRGRAENEIPQLLASHLPHHLPCQVAGDQGEAFAKAWARLQPGDRLVFIVDLVDQGLEALQMLAGESSCASPITAQIVQG